MNNEQINLLFDKKSSCLSAIINIKLEKYLEITNTAYKNDGAIEGQRKAQTSKSAVRIRHQMMSDFMDGGVLPPVVIGLTDPDFEESETPLNKSDLIYILENSKGDISIIDGMQRTTAMIEAVREAPKKDILSREIRVEVWISKSVTKLIYRMLVLNTGQLPWPLRRQLEVVMQPIKKEIDACIPRLTIMSANDSSRRTRPGEFQADKILELFLIFGARSEKADTRDFISEEFLKLDFIESASKSELLTDYIEILSNIVEFDIALSGIKSPGSGQRFEKGIDLFTSQPVLVGFVCALAIKIYGRPGADYEIERQRRNFDRILSSFKGFIRRVSCLSDGDLSEFMRFETLNHILGSRSSANVKIGDMERAYFRDAFTVLISEDFDIKNMDICWRA